MLGEKKCLFFQLYMLNIQFDNRNRSMKKRVIIGEAFRATFWRADIRCPNTIKTYYILDIVAEKVHTLFIDLLFLNMKCNLLTSIDWKKIASISNRHHNLKKDASGTAPLKKEGVLVSESKGKADILNKQYASVFRRHRICPRAWPQSTPQHATTNHLES